MTKPRPSPEALEAEFNALWPRYPNHEDRKDALRSYKARRRAGVPAEDLRLAVEGYVGHLSRQRPPVPKHFILRGATFFGPNERYVKYLEQARDAQAKAEEYPVDA